MTLMERLMLLARRLRPLVTTTKIKAVHDQDLEALLSSLGLSDNIAAGQMKCVKCGITITSDNIWAIRQRNKTIEVICSQPGCVSELEAPV